MKKKGVRELKIENLYSSFKTIDAVQVISSLHKALDNNNAVLLFLRENNKLHTVSVSYLLADLYAKYYKKKVLLLELLPSSIVSANNEEHTSGISDVIAGKVTLPEIIRKTDNQHFFHTNMGSDGTNINDLILNPEFEKLLGNLKEDYIVMLDSPPLAEIPNYLVISSLIDHAIMFLKSGASKKNSVIENKELLTQFNINLLGCVLLEEK